MTDEPMPGVAQDASTLTDVLATFEAQGFRGQFVARDGGLVECAHCGEKVPATSYDQCELRRLEGASDPADMLAVVAATCPNCETKGTLVLNYGPESSRADVEVLQGLDR